jgi:hypothetical protein
MKREFLRAAFCALPLLFASDQTGSAPANGTFEGTPSVTLSNDKMALTVLIEGATIANLALADDAEKLSPLWNPVRMARELGHPIQPTSAAGHFICVDGFGPVSAEERNTGLPGHGEAHLQKYDVHSSKQGRTTEVTMKATLPIVQESFTRIYRMVDGENVVYVESQLENLLGFDRPVNWAEHATVGSPFLESGVTVIDVSGSRSRTRPYDQVSNSNARTDRRLTSGQDFTWPTAPALGGKTVDMRVTPESPHYLDHTATLLDPSRTYEWVTALNPKRHLVVGWVFRRADYPWLQTWGNYPPTQKMSRGMEFGTQPFDVPRREAIGMGTMFDTATYRWLPAKSKIESRFLVFYTRVPDGFVKVDEVSFENGRLTIQDRKANKQIVLTASRTL